MAINNVPFQTIIKFLQESPVACVVANRELRIILCNYKAQQLAQVTAATLQDFVSKVFSAEQWLLFSELLEKHTSGELLLSRVEGSETKTFSVSLQREEGYIISWLREVSTSAEQKRFSLSALLSHELRAPLVSIRGYTELVATERIGPLNERQRRGLGIALRNIGNLVELIDNLLLYSRLTSGALIGKPTRQHMQTYLHEYLEEAKQQSAEKKIKLQAEIDEAPIYCRLDPVTFSVALRNLLSNALKFTGVEGTVTIKARIEAPKLLLSVSDSGIGIANELLSKIFEPFSQSEGVITRQSRGMGLGLAVSREIVAQHGGQLSVSSSPTQGSCFTISLPLSD